MKDKQKLILEAKKRYDSLCEYNFYSPPSDLNEDDDDMEDGFPEPSPDEVDPNGDDSITNNGNPDADPEMGEPSPENGEGDIPPGPEMDDTQDLPEPEGEINAPGSGEEESSDVEQEDGEIELDVTDLVDKTEEAKDASNHANMRIEDLMKQLNSLESKLPDMASISSKIEKLQQDIIERNPKPVEKLEMRSMNSYPYNLKLTDVWDSIDDNSNYDISNGENQNFEKDDKYVLTSDDIKSDYSEKEIQNSFNDYEEEDI